jgi:formylglycine-generating enzyme required for sulfatase activity
LGSATQAPATVSAFRLDAFEVTVDRFRRFVDTVILGPGLPAGGAGVRSYLGGGAGLNGGGDGGALDRGWNPAWNAMFPTQTVAGQSPLDQWNANLACSAAGTWGPLGNDSRPINCITWYEAYAFCLWDGGFLPTEAEWSFAASGGALQRPYPWGSVDPAVGCYAVFDCQYPQINSCNTPQSIPCNEASSANLATFGYALGQGAFGHWNLAGNVAEWTLDSYAPTYPVPCDDCATLSPGTQRVARGGGFDDPESFLLTSARIPADPAGRYADVGVRCLRAP